MVHPRRGAAARPGRRAATAGVDAALILALRVRAIRRCSGASTVLRQPVLLGRVKTPGDPMPRKRRLAVKASSVAMGQQRTPAVHTGSEKLLNPPGDPPCEF